MLRGVVYSGHFGLRLAQVHITLFVYVIESPVHTIVLSLSTFIEDVWCQRTVQSSIIFFF